MEIKITKPDANLAVNIYVAAENAKCLAVLKWDTPMTARFTLDEISTADGRADSASFEQHDQVIKALLERYPDARIRTARATFEGLADWQAQKEARVA